MDVREKKASKKRLIDYYYLAEKIECPGVPLVYWDDIEAAPIVDAVEVVRCRDCAKDGLFTCPICFIENKTLHFINHSPDFYCGEGERKDGGGYG